MMATISQARSFERPVQLLFLNQFTINIGFYMLMPYLAAHLSGDLGLAAWLVGLVLGVRNLTQQGMFLIGGTLADRLGYKRLIVAGCTLRTVGFALLGFVDSLPALIVASALTGFAGALFNPAVRAYLAQDAGERRTEAFAVFNVFYQAGIVIGPLLGVLLTGVSFQLTCAVAAAVFAGLTVVQARALPDRRPERSDPGTTGFSVLTDWRAVSANRGFLLFSLAMIGSYVLSFQVYLALPLQIRRLAPDEHAATLGVGALFVVSGGLAVATQVRITAWCRRRWSSGQAITRGLALMGVAFTPLLLVDLLAPTSGPAGAATGSRSWPDLVLAFTPVLAAAVILTLATLIVYPFEMDTIVTLSGNRLVATHYGLYSTVSGIGITVGNLATGAALDTSNTWDTPALPWLALSILGAACAWAIHRLGNAGLLTIALVSRTTTHTPS